MKVEQNLQTEGGKASKDLLYSDLTIVVPDISYPDGFYAEIKEFIFTNRHSFFDKKNQPPLLKQTLHTLSAENTENLLTVLEGVKALIQEYKLPDMAAYEEFMAHSKANRFRN